MMYALTDPERLRLAVELIGSAVVVGFVLWLLTTLWQACSMSRSESPLRQQLRHMADTWEAERADD